jgi:hypothetical protein
MLVGKMTMSIEKYSECKYHTRSNALSESGMSGIGQLLQSDMASSDNAHFRTNQRNSLGV